MPCSSIALRSDPRHHVNEMDGRHPGTGDYNFKPVFEAFAGGAVIKVGVSLEAFDFKPGAEKIAAESLRYIKGT